MSRKKASEPDPSSESNFQEKTKLVILFISAGLVTLLWGHLLSPFFPVLAWALAITSVMYPLHRLILARVSNRNLAAGISVLIIAIIIIGPATFATRELVKTASENASVISETLQQEPWKDKIRSSPKLGSIVRWANRNFNIQQNAQDLLTKITEQIPTIFTASIGSLINLLLVLFTSFYFLRDKSKALSFIRQTLPISNADSSEIFAQVENSIYATIYGTLVVSLIQGTLGGLIFWILGLPAPLLWGVIMALLALVPYFGTSLVWIPAAAFLAIDGSWDKALIMSIWGVLVVSSIDNLLYPLLVGKRLRFHTLQIFFFVLGGVIFFGFSGLILGPIALAVGSAIFEICRRRLSES